MTRSIRDQPIFTQTLKFRNKARRTVPEIATCASVAREFVGIIRERDGSAWKKWKEDAKTSMLASFAKHLCQDEAAVMAALQRPWSNGPVEGYVHRLKLIKRSMYGRAKFDLLRLRLVNTGWNHHSFQQMRTARVLYQK
jgi:transposase